MKINGLQKLTLLDFPGKTACTVFLAGCGFRCPWCHNYGLIGRDAPEALSEEEFFRFLEKRRGLLDGVAVTGGEPCLRPDLPDFLRKIKEAGFLTKLDTNGSNPGVLAEILRLGLADYVAMDLKNSPGKYARTVGLPYVDLGAIGESVSLLQNSGIPHEFRTTVIEGFHEESDFDEIGKRIEGERNYFLQPFADRDSVPTRGLSAPPRKKMEAFLERARKYVPTAEIRGAD